MSVAIYAAMTPRRVIGHHNALPWHVPDGYNCFLRCIDGETVIVGRKTWEIFGDYYTSSHTIVLTHQRDLPGVHTAHSLDDALSQARGHRGRIFIAGGGSVYEQALGAGVVDEIYMTVVREDTPGDTYFPEISGDEWEVIQRKRHPDYTYMHYRQLPVESRQGMANMGTEQRAG